jgi:putative transposase
MRNPLERRYGHRDLHFITFSCVKRHPLLGTAEARNCFVRILDEVRIRYAFRLVGYVVMPEHVHLLITESVKGNPSVAIQVLKQRVSCALLERTRNGARRAVAHFWQRRFYDFNVYSGKKITEKLNYMHLNPLKRDLVAHLKDWPWSSWSHYANSEFVLIPIDRWDERASGAENPHP